MNTGGPAFPVPDSHHANGQVQYGANGMTLLDWFAGQALAGLVSESGRYDAAGAALDAYNNASAMLAEKARREADHSGDANKMVEDHFRDAAKMTELEAQNRELVQALEVLVCVSEKVEKKGYFFAELDRGVVMARVALSKAKEAKP